jgi:hypothetical protein
MTLIVGFSDFFILNEMNKNEVTEINQIKLNIQL